MLGNTEFLLPNTERRERSTAGSLTFKPAIAPFLGLPVCAGTLPHCASGQQPARFRTAREPEAPGPGGRGAPPPASPSPRRRARRPRGHSPSGQGCNPRITSFRAGFRRLRAKRIFSYSFCLRLIRVILDHNKDGSSGLTKVTGQSFPNDGGTWVFIAPS